MAPTELLAEQHASNAAAFLGPAGVRIALLSGSVTGKNHEHLLENLRNGEIDLLIGTHALFSRDIAFKNLRLVIIDEQQRFGVFQRLSLMGKGMTPDLLMMTATPIPRTIALTVFGDLDVSTITTMPPGRQGITTHLAEIGKEEKVYEFVRRELENGRQAYFVYPLLERSEKIDLKDAESAFHLLKEKVFPEYKCALIHSRVPEDEKSAVMRGFQKGEIAVLVATSVVEVGVDIPNAACMVIEHAERFGLSSLHQLRGRIGRGENRGYAFLVYGQGLSAEAKARLRIMKSTTDGFRIAEEDLKIRGPGEITGTRQSGYLKLTIADIVRDFEPLKEARVEAQRILDEDPGLIAPENQVIRKVLSRCPPFDSETLDSG